MNKQALFCDGTGVYVIPPEPVEDQKIILRFRTAKDDVQEAKVVTRETCYSDEEGSDKGKTIFMQKEQTAEDEKQRTKNETTVYEETTGGQTPYVKKELVPTVEGVVVLCEGGDQPVVVQEITEAVEALFSVESHKIKVVKMK